ncbi:hypothetical protein [Virgibacillus halodenitrificans]|uniref:Uncharacterized protein n=1 Tax=Virgibacillus halodenitrificans TaxID=1482 RepID=A0AAC9J3E2_VIRHA|nr:hypothetical protein [Virgibacillus halodenitrificans]APC49797.1 hypothetical protein BME96_17060 [Virgibacillus halodenitrificans]MBD1221536.1 hypothetical protein [Virgibacillus halodenitrificans]MCG1030289.1 hypothetical protein [Virgibacillus halodenitrificans]MYL45502.1 hypothetical protein [Virgibacillus halodenitrificans]MYL58810.1 hypothetical protein [Virgibacillus halodenitrificans]
MTSLGEFCRELQTNLERPFNNKELEFIKWMYEQHVAEQKGRLKKEVLLMSEVAFLKEDNIHVKNFIL